MFSLLIYPICHELGHFIMAHILGGKILEISYLHVYLLPYSIMNTRDFILFKLGGLIFTFYPSLLLFFYFWHKKSEINFCLQNWILLSPLSSINDVFQIMSLFKTSYIETALIFTYIIMYFVSITSYVIYIIYFLKINNVYLNDAIYSLYNSARAQIKNVHS
jgi:hypothetical protein